MKNGFKISPETPNFLHDFFLLNISHGLIYYRLFKEFILIFLLFLEKNPY